VLSPVRSQVGLIAMLDLGTTKGNGTLVPDRQARWSGAPAHHPWDARTRCQKAPPARRRYASAR